MARLTRVIRATQAPVGASTGLLWRLAALLVGMTVLIAAFSTLTLAARGGATLQFKAPGGAYSIQLDGKPTAPTLSPPRAAAAAKPPG